MRENRPSTTAEAVALWRALEQAYPIPQRILQDPYAEKLIRKPMRRFLSYQKQPSFLQFFDGLVGGGTMIYTILRHGWMEDAFRRALAEESGLSEVMVLGAGYDMRAFRLPELQHRRVVEIDHPATSARKKRCVERLGVPDSVERVVVDFAQESVQHALERVNFSRSGWFFWEGVSMYLSEAAVRATLSALADWGCSGVMDFYSPPLIGGLSGVYHKYLPGVAGLVGEKVDFCIAPDRAEAFLQSCGFELVELVRSRAMIPDFARDRVGMHPNPHGFGVWVRSRR